jgi:hypothetical protein
MKHPNPDIQSNQEEFLKNCPDEQKAFHERLFRIGNAAIHYHQLTDDISEQDLETYFYEWLAGLPVNIRADMERKGLEQCRYILPFTRYVNERQDIGLEEWMKEHLSEEDYRAYKETKKK